MRKPPENGNISAVTSLLAPLISLRRSVIIHDVPSVCHTVYLPSIRALQRRLRRALLEANATNRRHPARPTCTGWAEKVGRRLTTIILSNLNRFKFTGKFLGKFVVKWIPKLPPHLACVATLPCEILMSAKEANGDGVVNNHLTTNLPTNFLVTF